MKVLFLLIAYPDIRENTNMYTDLTCEFKDKGHEVHVAAPGKNKTRIGKEGNISVLRIKTLPLFNTSTIIKGISNLLLPFQYKRAIEKHLGNIRFDLVVTPTPPITFIEIAEHLKKKHKAKIYLILRDIFPQNAKDLGLIKNPLIFRYFRNKEKKLYKIADSIGCMSPRNMEYLHIHNPEVNIKKLHLLPNWTRVNETTDRVVATGKFDFKDKFVAIFGGNFGIPQKIEFILDVADKLKDRDNIFFYLIGNGTEYGKIKKIICDRNLKNVIIIKQLPRTEYLDLLKECHVGLVNLSDKFTIPNIPSRTLSYWSVKIPVLAAVDESTDYGELLDSCKGGLWSITGNIDDYITNLLYLYNNPEKRMEMGENGYKFLVKELNPTSAYLKIISSLISL